ncbi:hypothetical protein EV196_101282 [Mariniflexile fucanivorans]|uniref:Uncharacterized protein n=1 Tax=Mariniflexile fucanivorans TaxID=264023 RepID=A0A4V6NGZ2_9FLAO|nr:hypothetical protein [Mariniflexile fucanivorans]TCL68857.1 hypothetical protein EV196_101282 [Mariniflexile fucanivorans]
MKIIEFFKDFWLDFFAAYYKRLKKNAAYETPISIVLHLSFTQAVNFNTVIVIVLHLFTSIKLNFIILFLPIVLLCLINFYYFYHKLNKKQRKAILNKEPKYKIILYDLYDVFSTILFMLSLYVFSKG